MWHDFLVPMCCCLRTHRLSLCKWFVISKAAAQTQPLQCPWLCHWHPRMGRLSWCLTGLRLASACHSSRHLGARNDHPVLPQTFWLSNTNNLDKQWQTSAASSCSRSHLPGSAWCTGTCWPCDTKLHPVPPTSAAGGLPPPEQASQAAAFGADQPHPSQRRACIVPLKYSCFHMMSWCRCNHFEWLKLRVCIYIYIEYY